MARPFSERMIRGGMPPRVMKPAGIPVKDLEEVALGYDEAEALRLSDLLGLYHEAAARSMGISRPTFGRIIESARRKVADAILSGKALRIEGGTYTVRKEGAEIVKIAVPSNNGLVDDHFGHCKEFLVFKAEGSKLYADGSIPSLEGCGCKSGIASVLAAAGVTHLVGGNMGEGALRVLSSHGITVIRGASGDAAKAAAAFLDGALSDSGQGCAGHDAAQGSASPNHNCAH